MARNWRLLFEDRFDAMNTLHRFKFPNTKHAPMELPPDFDLHVNIGDRVEWEAMPGEWLVTQKKFKVLFDNSIEYIDYEVQQA